MAQKREKEETELKVPTPIPTPPKLSATDEPTSTRSLVSSDPMLDQTIRAGTGSEISDLNLNLDLDLLPPRTQQAAEEDSDVKRREVNRCSGCQRKVGLTGFRCRCGDLFCSEHRYSDRHDCSFDYKAAGREAISRENPVVRPAKILKV